MEDYCGIPLQIRRSRRKTLSVRVCGDGSLMVSAPLRMSDRQILAFLQEKDHWVKSHAEKVRSTMQTASASPLSGDEIKELRLKAKAILQEKVKYYAGRMQVTYGNITVRCQQGRWGSCSAQGNLSFNCLLMLAPEAVQDYVVVHELAHRKQMNHSAAFWNEVALVLPDYRNQVLWLKRNGAVLIERMRLGEKESAHV